MAIVPKVNGSELYVTIPLAIPNAEQVITAWTRHNYSSNDYQRFNQLTVTRRRYSTPHSVSSASSHHIATIKPKASATGVSCCSPGEIDSSGVSDDSTFNIELRTCGNCTGI